MIKDYENELLCTDEFWRPGLRIRGCVIFRDLRIDFKQAVKQLQIKTFLISIHLSTVFSSFKNQSSHCLHTVTQKARIKNPNNLIWWKNKHDLTRVISTPCRTQLFLTNFYSCISHGIVWCKQPPLQPLVWFFHSHYHD